MLTEKIKKLKLRLNNGFFTSWIDMDETELLTVIAVSYAAYLFDMSIQCYWFNLLRWLCVTKIDSFIQRYAFVYI